MDSVTAGLKKAKEEHRRAETEVYSSENPLTQSLLKAKTCFQRSSSIPQFSGHKPSSKTSVYHGNQNANHRAIKVIWNQDVFVI